MAESIPDTMQAAQVVEFNKPYKLQEVPVPKDLGPNDILIKVAVASLCHTDFMVRSGTMPTTLPCTASHEGSGTIIALGSSTPNFRLGDRIMAGILYRPCGTCPDCLGPESYTQYCAHSAGYLGVTTHGFFAEYARIDARFAVKIPDSVAFETAAPLACAGGTVWRGVLLADLKVGEWIGIVGSGGGLGHLGIQFAKARGLNVVGIDARDEGIQLSTLHGADLVVDARNPEDDVVKHVHGVTNGEGVAVTLNVSDAEKALETAVAITRTHGTVIQIAQPNILTLPFHPLIFRDIRIRSSLMCSPAEAAAMLSLVAEHDIRVSTNKFHGLGQIERLVELAESGRMAGKGVIVVDGSLV